MAALGGRAQCPGRTVSKAAKAAKPAKPRRTAADGLSRFTSEAERREVNSALDRRATWREVATICAKHGRKGITSQNVTNYRQSADRADWMRKQERLEAIRRESELTAEIVRHYAESGGSPAEAGLLAASEAITRAIVDGLGEATLAEMVADPAKLMRALDLLTKITGAIQRERHAPKPEEAPAAADPAEAARKLREIFGLPGN